MKLKIFIIFLTTLFLSSCGASKKTTRSKTKPTVVLLEPAPPKLPSVKEIQHVNKLDRKNSKLNKHTLKYIRKYAPIAVNEMHLSKIPASITLAQGVLESASGRSHLATISNNHCGIKCHTKWKGQRVYHDDDERGECFRKYTYVETSYKDHSAFLTQRKRYAFLFEYNKKDYKKWARGLKKAGYATDKNYPKKLIKIIETYKLYEFDKVKKKDFKVQKKEIKSLKIVKRKNIIDAYYEVKKGDTLYSLSRKFNTTVARLKEINGLKSNTLSIGQQILTK
jgi:flagellum-specific peptidoglycan hydrolase FlgJ